MANIPEITVAPENVMQIGSMGISNSVVSTTVAVLLLFVFFVYIKRSVSVVPGRVQIVAEAILTFFEDALINAYGDRKRARKYLPMILGLFLLIFLSNQFTLIPFVQSIVTEDGVAFFRAPTSHFSLPLMLALIVFVVSQVVAISISPLKYIGNFIKIGEFFKIRKFADVPKALLDNFLGVLDIIGELAKVVSLSARLFGNVFAGEVMVAVISGLSAYTQFVVPVPFYALGLFSGFIQALVFSVLALSFMSGLSNTVEASVAVQKNES